MWGQAAVKSTYIKLKNLDPKTKTKLFYTYANHRRETNQIIIIIIIKSQRVEKPKKIIIIKSQRVESKSET
jgi:hypothetical protein